MPRCLITGHMGYIGTHLYTELVQQGHEVRGIDLKEGKSCDILDELREDAHGSFHSHWASFKPEFVFHLACFPRVGFSIEHPVATMRNNALGGSIVLNYARKMGAKRVIYSSSSSVVGNGQGPLNPYSLQKLITEKECKLYSDLYTLDTVALRYFNVYSVDQEANGPYATVVSNWRKYMREGRNPFITGTGEQRRDMAHVSDVVSANIFAMNYEQSFGGAHFDVGTGSNISLNELKDFVLERFPQIKFDHSPARAGEMVFTQADPSKLHALGWRPKITIIEGLKQCFV